MSSKKSTPDRSSGVGAAAMRRDRFILYLRGKIDKLNPQEKELYDQIDVANNLICTWGKKKAREMLQKKYGVSIRTAYRIILDAIHIYGSMNRDEKSYFQNMAVDKILRALTGIEGQIIKEDENGNPIPITDPKLVKEYVGLLAELRRTVRYDREDDPDMPDWSKIGANPIEITSDPETIGIEKIKPSEIKKLKDEILRNIERGNSQDVEFEEL